MARCGLQTFRSTDVAAPSVSTAPGNSQLHKCVWTLPCERTYFLGVLLVITTYWCPRGNQGSCDSKQKGNRRTKEPANKDEVLCYPPPSTQQNNRRPSENGQGQSSRTNGGTVMPRAVLETVPFAFLNLRSHDSLLFTSSGISHPQGQELTSHFGERAQLSRTFSGCRSPYLSFQVSPASHRPSSSSGPLYLGSIPIFLRN